MILPRIGRKLPRSKTPALATGTRSGAPGFSVSHFPSSVYLLLRQQAEDAYAVGRPHVDFAVGDGWGDVFIASAELIAVLGSLVGVVDLQQVGSVVGVKDSGVRVLGGPYDSVLT